MHNPIAKSLGLSVGSARLMWVLRFCLGDYADWINLMDFMQPPMSESRKAIITKAFQKMDKTGDGSVTADDLKG